MPIYTYQCPDCEEVFDIGKSMTSPHPTVCPACEYEGELDRRFNIPGITFRGSGFYHTDKKLDEITDPEYQLNDQELNEYYDEKLRHGDDRKIKVFT